MFALLNGHAGAGLGEILIAVAIAALALTAGCFWRVYRRRPYLWLRFLGLLYAGGLLAILAVVGTLFGFEAAIIILAYVIIVGLPAAILLWIAEALVARLES